MKCEKNVTNQTYLFICSVGNVSSGKVFGHVTLLIKITLYIWEMCAGYFSRVNQRLSQLLNDTGDINMFILGDQFVFFFFFLFNYVLFSDFPGYVFTPGIISSYYILFYWLRSFLHFTFYPCRFARFVSYLSYVFKYYAAVRIFSFIKPRFWLYHLFFFGSFQW